MERDNLDPLVTQCPNCDTRFRVTESQLQVAGGRVRCGACLSVFDGASRLIIDGESIAAAGEEDLDALLEELEDPVEEGVGEQVDDDDVEELVEDGAGDTAADSIELDLDELVDDTVHEALHDDLAGPDSLDDRAYEEAADSNEREPQSELDELDLLEAELLADLKGEKPAREYEAVDLDSSESDSSASDEPETAQLDDAPLTDDAVTEGGLDEVEAATPPTMTSAEVAAAQDEDAADFGWREEEGVDSESDKASPEIPNLIEEELTRELAEANVASRSVSWTTLFLIVLCVIGIPAQLLWFQFDSWSKDPDLRPLYAQVCNVIGCELPQRADISSIIAENAVLRPHPDVPDVLIYDALLVNQAAFAQPFPLLELTLTSIRGHLVAGRRFAPEEYLTEDLLKTNLMPPRTPIHISLEIKDPGQAPLNFRIRFLKDNPDRLARVGR